MSIYKDDYYFSTMGFMNILLVCIASCVMIQAQDTKPVRNIHSYFIYSYIYIYGQHL